MAFTIFLAIHISLRQHVHQEKSFWAPLRGCCGLEIKTPVIAALQGGFLEASLKCGEALLTGSEFQVEPFTFWQMSLGFGDILTSVINNTCQYLLFFIFFIQVMHAIFKNNFKMLQAVWFHLNNIIEMTYYRNGEQISGWGGRGKGRQGQERAWRSFLVGTNAPYFCYNSVNILIFY